LLAVVAVLLNTQVVEVLAVTEQHHLLQ